MQTPLRVVAVSILAALGALTLSGCSPDTRLEDASAAMKAAVAAYDNETAEFMDSVDDPSGTAESVSIFDMTAAGLVRLCDDEDDGESMAMGMMLFLNYGLEDALAEGWAAACPGEPFPLQ